MRRCWCFLPVSALAALVVIGCSNPLIPTPAVEATLSALSIAPGVSWIFVGERRTLSAIGTYSDGVARRLPATWTSETPTVVAVASDGTVTALEDGTGIIAAQAAGRTARLTLRAATSFGGRWSGGTIARLSCEASDPVEFPCPPEGLLFYDLTIVLAQTDVAVSGSMSMSNGVVDGQFCQVRGDLSADGALSLAGQQTWTELEVEYISFAIERWIARVAADGRLSGSMIVRSARIVGRTPATQRLSLTFSGLQRE